MICRILDLHRSTTQRSESESNYRDHLIDHMIEEHGFHILRLTDLTTPKMSALHLSDHDGKLPSSNMIDHNHDG